MNETRRDGRESAPASLAPARAAFDEGPPFDVDASFAAIAAEVGADAGLGRRIGEMPLRVRALGAVGMVAAVVISIGVLGFRPEAFGAGLAHTLLETIPLAALLVVSVLAAMRPWYLPPLGFAESAALVVASLVASTLVALFPDSPTLALAPLPSAEVVAGAPCFSIGTGLGIAAYVATRILHRGPSGQALFAASAAGLAANAALSLHCTVGDVGHRLASHAGVAYAFVLAMGLATLLARKLRR